MKRYLASTAILLALGTAAQANPFAEASYDEANKLYASDLIGARVYTSENDVDMDMADASADDRDWNDIGEIDELILSRDGTVQSVIIGVGGFLGIGEKDVAVNMTEINFVSDGEAADEYFLVVKASTADLEDAPAYMRDMTEDQASMEAEMEDAGTEMATATNDLAQDAENAAEETGDAIAQSADAVEAGAENMAEEVETAADETAAEMEDTTEMAASDAKAAMTPMLTAPSVERDGYSNVALNDLNTEDLTGARVYGTNDEDIGEVSELLLTSDGKIDRAVIDIGGFLGMGEHPIALTMDELQIVRSDSGGSFRVFIDGTEESLEKLPAYEG